MEMGILARLLEFKSQAGSRISTVLSIAGFRNAT